MKGKRGSVEGFFAKHAGDYSKSPSHAAGSDLAALMKALRPKKTEVALDVATGTGFTAVTLARLVDHVTGTDLTDKMLDEARALALAQGTANTRFERGDALAIDYPGSSFDIVTTRRATHHFDDVPKFLREARRVLKLGGRLGVVDMSPPEGAEVFSNNIERLRDNSHVEAFTPTAWKSMVLGAGFHITSVEVLGEHVSFERWLYPVTPEGEEEKSIRLAWESAPATVRRLMRADIRDGNISGWTKTRIILVASKTP